MLSSSIGGPGTLSVWGLRSAGIRLVDVAKLGEVEVPSKAGIKVLFSALRRAWLYEERAFRNTEYDAVRKTL